MRRTVIAALASLTLSSPLAAQGEFVNFETPQVRPITVAEVGGHEWLLVCNTPDDSIEVYDASSPYAFVQRIPVGLGPVTVRWNAARRCFYSCNFDGDSVSMLRLEPRGGKVRAILERTVHVGDEPGDIVFTADQQSAVVSLSATSRVVRVSAANLAPLGPAEWLTVPGTLGDHAVKAPRAMEMLDGDRLVVANFMGDRPRTPSFDYDLDLYVHDPALEPAAHQVRGLGTTHHAFAATRDGGQLFVVGTLAEHRAGIGVAAVRALKTGFVQSWMWVVDLPRGGIGKVRAEAPGGQVPRDPMPSLDLWIPATTRATTTSGT